MNTRHLPIALSVQIAVLVISCAVSIMPSHAWANDDKTYHGTWCSAETPATDDVRFLTDGVYNYGTSTEWVVCPVVRDTIEFLATDYFDYIEVYVHDGSATGTLTAEACRMDRYGTSNCNSDSTGAAAFTGDATLTIYPNTWGYGDDTTYYVRVELPGVYNVYYRSLVLGYYVSEDSL